MAVQHLDSLTCRNPLPQTAAPARLDPMFQGMWESSRQWSWQLRGERGAEAQAGLEMRTWPHVADVEQARFEVCRGPSRERSLAVWASVNMWRTATSQQVAALCQSPTLSMGRSPIVERLWNADVIHIGEHPRARNEFPLLLRNSSNGHFNRLRRHMTFDQWVRLTAGLSWRWGTQASRHNVLACELGLRCAEYLPVALSAGEHLAGFRAMQLPGVNLPWMSANLSSDAMVVRSDGLSIMFEVTASSSDFAQKAERWAELLESDRNHRLVVVFVAAPNPFAGPNTLMQGMRRDIAKAARGNLGRITGQVATRMMLTSWFDWFPSAHHVDDRFKTLTCMRPTGSKDDRWEEVDVLDPFALDGPSDAGALPLVANSYLFDGLAPWLRPQAGPGPTALWGQVHHVEPFPRRVGVKPPPQVRAALKAERERLVAMWQ